MHKYTEVDILKCLALQLHMFAFSLFSVLTGRTKLAWLRAEVGRDLCDEGSRGKERHSYCL